LDRELNNLITWGEGRTSRCREAADSRRECTEDAPLFTREARNGEEKALFLCSLLSKCGSYFVLIPCILGVFRGKETMF